PLPNPPASHVDSGFVSWNAYAILKDDSTRRAYTFGEMVSGMSGNDVGVVQRPYSVLPSEGGGFFSGCDLAPNPNPEPTDFVIENIPYAVAVPMLTGWDLEYPCDQHVKEIGIGIQNWEYQPPSGGMGGRLSYNLTSVLRDKDNDPDHAVTHK